MARLRRLRSMVAEANFDAVLAASPANVFYATGYRRPQDGWRSSNRMVALVAGDKTFLVGPSIDSAPALDGGLDPDSYVSYGRFYFESLTDDAAPMRMVDENPNLVSAVADAIHRAGLRAATLGVDEAGLGWETRRRIEAELPNIRLADASESLLRVRSAKLPGEIEFLACAARLAEKGIGAALEAARPGATERELAAIIASVMAAEGGNPRLVVVTSGERSALADVLPSERRLLPGDILRLDVGCVVEGYCSDVARTAVLGEPDERQVSRYGALLAGQEAEIASARAGANAGELFDAAVAAVLGNGFARYRRNHTGHGIGIENYEPPLIAPGVDERLADGAVLCLETPYYELGWGGMMVEDTVAITATGCQMLTDSNRDLRVVPA